MSDDATRCPRCGQFASEDSFCGATDVTSHETEFGIQIRWVEIHCCTLCGNIFTFDDSDL